jgi:SAM-dependent methyltransferase
MVARSQDDAALLDALELLRRRREPYADLLARIVADALQRSPPLPGLPIVEIGAGTGQLRGLLASPLRERAVHTDPSARALRALRERSPDAKTRVAPAERLPFDAGSVGQVVALCVFDALDDPAAAVAELGRVIAPGGTFVHVMDMATLLEAPFAKLAAAGLVPLPNVFGDPGDHDWPLDIVLVKRAWLTGLLAFATARGHQLAAAFGGYFKAFSSETFDAIAATNGFKAIASSGPSRSSLRALLESAARLAFADGHPPIEPLPFHSARYLQSVLQTCFRESPDFKIEIDEIVTRAAWRTGTGGGAGGARYRSLCLGHQRVQDELPRRLLDPLLPPRPVDASGGAHDPCLTEVGAFVFAARRIG